MGKWALSPVAGTSAMGKPHKFGEARVLSDAE